MSPTATRYASVDVLRGAAIVLMISYHFSWDLSYFGFADFRVTTDQYWIWYARFIAGTILLVMGISQAIVATRPFNRHLFLRRLLIVTSAALTVSIGTYAMDPQTFVFFGILHHIALVSILMIFLIRLPSGTLAGLAVISLLAPTLLRHEIFFAKGLWWVGLTPVAPLSVDYVPLLPWLGLSLVGVVVGRYCFAGTSLPGWPGLVAWQPTGIVTRLLRLAGRHSLFIYLIHQPLLFGGTYAVYLLLNS